MLAPGSMLGSRWIVGGRLGHSDTADVYEAEATSERRFAALKVFDTSFASEPAWSEHAELTRNLSELPGDGIARAYDLGVEPDCEAALQDEPARLPVDECAAAGRDHPRRPRHQPGDHPVDLRPSANVNPASRFVQ